MLNDLILRKCLIVIGITAVLSACSGNTNSTKTMRFCDEAGCSDRPSTTANASYMNETGVVKSQQILQLEKEAENDARAAYDLALRYFRGDGVQQNSYQAIQSMRKAGEKGLLEAQKALGGYYLTGFQEMGSDPQEAEKWLSMAAAQGDKESALRLTEATEAKKAAFDDYESRKRWKEYYRESWYRSYPYMGRWNHGYWRY